MKAAVVAVGLLGAALTAGTGRTASQVFKEGQKAERSGEILQAYLLYSQAAALEPKNLRYWARSQALRRRASLLAAPSVSQGNPKSAVGVDFRDVTGTITDLELAEARKPQPPLELKASLERKDLDFRGDSRRLFEQVARAYGLEAIFDADYQPVAPFRFQLAGAGYREALHALEASTASFVTPLTERLFLVARDNAQKRVELELTSTVAIPLPETVTPQDAQEVARAVQQALQIVRVTVDTTRHIVLLRDRVSRVGPALELFHQLLRRRAEVAIDVEFLEVGELSSSSYGMSLQTMFPLVYFGGALNAEPSVPAGFARFLAFGGGRTLFGLGVTDASVFARMSRSLGRSLLRSVVRSADGQEVSLHVGDRFPIVTSTFLSPSSGDAPPIPPAISFEDLGLVLKLKPKVHGAREVSLEVDAEFKVLTGEAVNAIPVVADRKLQSQIRLRNREWAAVAGLMSASEARSITGPAGLARLPVAGSLLRESNQTKHSRNVLLLLRPTILSPPPSEQATDAVPLGAEMRPRTPL